MDWRVFLAAFTAVFFAELADKTQFVSMTMSAKTNNPLSVWVGSVAAYIIITLVSVLIGAVMARFFKPEIIRYVSATSFVIIGLLIFFKVL